MQNLAMTLAGWIGVTTAIFHGILTQRLMVKPIERRLTDAPGVSMTIRRLVPLLLHVSTFSWLLGGIALILAAQIAGAETRLWISLLVGSLYLYAAVANCWATRGRHPGWILMASTVGLITFDLLA